MHLVAMVINAIVTWRLEETIEIEIEYNINNVYYILSGQRQKRAGGYCTQIHARVSHEVMQNQFITHFTVRK